MRVGGCTAMLAASSALSGAAVAWAIMALRRRPKAVRTVTTKALSSRVQLFAPGVDWSAPSELSSAFASAFDPILEAFLAHIADDFKIQSSFVERLRAMSRYTILGGKCNRAIVLVANTRDLCAYRGIPFVPGPAIILGWCIEILQASFLVADDVMDGSVTRRDQPCWYKRDDVKMDAVNDALILESFVFWLIKAEFAADRDQYVTFMDLFRDTTFQTEIGQLMDLLSQPQGAKGPDVLKRFSRDTLNKIVKYKTSYYSFYVPIACSMILSGFDAPEQLRVAEEISMMLGEKFQAQDDFLDCFGDPEVIGKIGTDIQDHKCTWLLVNALERCSPSQRQIIESNLGVDDKESIARVKKVYNDLGLPALFAEYEVDSHARIADFIEANKSIVPPVAFQCALNLIHKRSR